MRIVVVNQKLGYSSATSYSFELSRALKERGHQLRLCTTGGDFLEIFKREGIESYMVKSNFFSFRKLTQFLREFDPQLIHIHNLRSLAMGKKLSEHLGKSYIVTVHHTPRRSRPVLRNPLLAGLIALNETVRETLVNIQGIDKSLIRMIGSGVHVERFQPGDPPLSARDKLPVIGSIGRLEPVKGYQYFIAAARMVLDRDREAQFAIVGDGPEESSLSKQIKKLALEKHFHLCPPLPDLAELLRNFDIVVLPTLRGGVGLATLEAMAMARPVVASAVGENLQIIRDGESGLLVPERDPEAIAEKVVHLLDHPEEATRLGQSARKLVEENFSLTPMVDATEQFYNDVFEEVAQLEV